MNKLSLGLFSILLIGLMIVGCSERPTDPVSVTNFNQLANFILPQGATFESATFYINVIGVSGRVVNVYRVTDNWDETTITWSNFGDAYAPEVYGSFTADAAGWHSVDLTTMVQEWLDGTYDNFGFVLDQNDISYPRSFYPSRETSDAPFMEICYSMNGEQICETIYPEGDSFINEYMPDDNFGTEEVLFTGWAADGNLEKQSMLMFDFSPQVQYNGCTRTIGYWKNHAGCGPQADMITPLLPIWLGTPGGSESIEVTTAAMAKKILSQRYYCRARNGVTKLYAQMLAAKLNVANGANPEALGSLFQRADAFLADHDCGDWRELRKKRKMRILRWKTRFDRYNNGLIGPGHCD